MTTRRKFAGAALSALLILAPVIPAAMATAGAAPAAEAASITKVVPAAKLAPSSKIAAYKNCTALSKVHPAGVARPGVKVNIANGKKKALKGKPTYSKALYNANKKLDRDKDGIACEK